MADLCLLFENMSFKILKYQQLIGFLVFTDLATFEVQKVIFNSRSKRRWIKKPLVCDNNLSLN